MDVNRNPDGAGRSKFSKRDGVIVLSLLVVALIIGVLWDSRPPKGGLVCNILYNRELVMSVALDKDQVFSIDELPQVVFEVKDGRIAFIESDCPDQVCVHTGFIGKNGQFAACLPNHIAIRIEGEHDEFTPDAIA